MLLLSIVPWDPTTRIPPTCHLRYPDGNSIFPKDKTPADHLQEEGVEDHHFEHQDPPPSGGGGGEGAVAGVVVEEGAGDHSHYLGKHLPKLKSS